MISFRSTRDNKKGFELRNLAGLVITFVVLAIILSFGGTIVTKLQVTMTEYGTKDVVNYTGSDTSMTTGDIESLPENDRLSCSLSNLIITNTTSEYIPFNAANYSVIACAITWIGDEGSSNDTELNYSYTATYIDEKAAYNASASGNASLTEFSDWLPTLALIVIAAVVIGIIVRFFAFGGS